MMKILATYFSNFLKAYTRLCLAVVAIVVSFPLQALNLDELIRQRVEFARFHDAFVMNEKLLCQQSLFTFYSKREFLPAWGDDKNVNELIRLIEMADDHGLYKEDYHYQAIRHLWRNREKLISLSIQADLDVLLTDAYLLFAGHMLSGKVDPKSFDTNWYAVKNEGFPSEKLETALQNGVLKSLNDLVPNEPGYYQMADFLKKYKQIKKEGPWEKIATKEKKLQKGYKGGEIVLLRERLRRTGDYIGRNTNDSLFDETLETSVKHFQQRHGLLADGIVGQSTLEAMNVPVEIRIDQIVTNMERFRWLTRNLGERYIMVNIANFEMSLYENDEKMLGKRVVVGKPYRKTPVFSSSLSYLVLNPTWTVPPTILNVDILPAQKKDPSTITKKNLKILTMDGKPVDPASIDWSQYPKKTFPYQLRQDPGPDNALGSVKFIFPNSFNVYLHDTPQKDLFDKPERALSSGCIRVEKPLELAEVLLNQNPGWTKEKINQTIPTRKTETVFLKKKVNVHLQYFTSWVNDEGLLNFRKDIYERDPLVINALNNHLPTIDLTEDVYFR